MKRNKKGQFIKGGVPHNFLGLTKKCILCSNEFRVRKVNFNRRKYCSYCCYWKDLKNQIPYNKGKKQLSTVGTGNHNWKGDEVGYDALHDWVKRNKVKIGVCSMCDKKTKTQWANVSRKYKRELTDFVELCCSCHKIADGKKLDLRPLV